MAENERLTKRFKASYHEIVRIEIKGCVQHMTFDAHKSIICYHSRLVEKLCRKSELATAGISSQVIPLSNICKHTFNTYLHWIYSGVIDLALDATETGSTNCAASLCLKSHGSSSGDQIISLIKFYNIARKLQDIKLKNKVIDTLVSMGTERCLMNQEVVKIVYATTLQSSKLRDWLLDAAACTLTGVEFNVRAYPAAFRDDLISRLLDQRTILGMDGAKAQMVGETYHEKETEEQEAAH